MTRPGTTCWRSSTRSTSRRRSCPRTASSVAGPAATTSWLAWTTTPGSSGWTVPRTSWHAWPSHPPCAAGASGTGRIGLLTRDKAALLTVNARRHRRAAAGRAVARPRAGWTSTPSRSSSSGPTAMSRARWPAMAGSGTSRTRARRPSRSWTRRHRPPSCSTAMPPEAIAQVAARGRGHAPQVDLLRPQGTDRAGHQPAGVVGEPTLDTGESERMDPEPPSGTAAIAGNGRGYHDGDIGGRTLASPCARTRSCSRSAASTSSRGCPSAARAAGRSSTCTASWRARGSGSTT